VSSVTVIREGEASAEPPRSCDVNCRSVSAVASPSRRIPVRRSRNRSVALAPVMTGFSTRSHVSWIHHAATEDRVPSALRRRSNNWQLQQRRRGPALRPVYPGGSSESSI
jgi:hypothetical protein